METMFAIAPIRGPSRCFPTSIKKFLEESMLSWTNETRFAVRALNNTPKYVGQLMEEVQRLPPPPWLTNVLGPGSRVEPTASNETLRVYGGNTILATVMGGVVISLGRKAPRHPPRVSFSRRPLRLGRFQHSAFFFLVVATTFVLLVGSDPPGPPERRCS